MAIVDVDDGTVEPLFEIDGGIAFVVSPDGTKIAYQILESADVDTRPVNQPRAQTDQPDVLVAFDRRKIEALADPDDRRFQELRLAIAGDLSYLATAKVLAAREDFDFFAVYFRGFDLVCHQVDLNTGLDMLEAYVKERRGL